MQDGREYPRRYFRAAESPSHDEEGPKTRRGSCGNLRLARERRGEEERPCLSRPNPIESIMITFAAIGRHRAAARAHIFSVFLFMRHAHSLPPFTSARINASLTSPPLPPSITPKHEWRRRGTPRSLRAESTSRSKRLFRVLVRFNSRAKSPPSSECASGRDLITVQ